jgi:hypothetical protein
VPSGRRCHPSDSTDHDDAKGEEDMDDGEIGTRNLEGNTCQEGEREGEWEEEGESNGGREGEGKG